MLAHRNDLPLERLYGDVGVSIASRVAGGSQTNPVGQDRRATAAGREPYTGSCAQCHGANGDGTGVFGQATYPKATDPTGHDAREKSAAQLFWIVKNGLSFTGMPDYAGQSGDRDIWSLVSHIRGQGQGQGQAAPIAIPTPGAQPNPGSAAIERRRLDRLRRACRSEELWPASCKKGDATHVGAHAMCFRVDAAQVLSFLEDEACRRRAPSMVKRGRG